MAYRPQAPLGRRVFGFGFAFVIQAVLLYGLATGLIQKGIKKGIEEVETTVLPPQEKPPDAPPPPPPPVDVPPPYIPPPDIQIEAPASQNAPTQVQTQSKPPAIIYPKPSRTCGLPDYPATEKRLGHEGKVVIYLCIGADGALTDAQIKQSSGFPLLDQSAVAWARKCRWSPAVVAGQKQAICFDQPYRFQLKDQ